MFLVFRNTFVFTLKKEIQLCLIYFIIIAFTLPQFNVFPQEIILQILSSLLKI